MNEFYHVDIFDESGNKIERIASVPTGDKMTELGRMFNTASLEAVVKIAVTASMERSEIVGVVSESGTMPKHIMILLRNGEKHIPVIHI